MQIGYRYSTSGFYDFSDAVAERNNWQNGFYHTQYCDQSDDKPARRIGRRKPAPLRDSQQYNNKRQRVEMTVNQHIAGASAVRDLIRQNTGTPPHATAPSRPVSTPPGIASASAFTRTAAVTTVWRRQQLT